MKKQKFFTFALFFFFVSMSLLAQQQMNREQIRSKLGQWFQSEVLPQLQQWKKAFDQSLAPEDLEKLNQLRQQARQIREQQLKEREALREQIEKLRSEAEKYREEAESLEEWREMKREELRKLKEQLKQKQRAYREQLKPLYEEAWKIAEEYQESLQNILEEAKPQMEQWREQMKQMLKEMKKMRKEDPERKRFHRKMFPMKEEGVLMPDFRKKHAVLRFILWDGTNPLEQFRSDIHSPLPPQREEVTLKVAPNPSGSNVQIYITSSIAQQAVLKVLDANGQILEQQTVSLHKGEQSVTLRQRSYPNGQYYIQLVFPDRKTVRQSFTIAR